MRGFFLMAIVLASCGPAQAQEQTKVWASSIVAPDDESFPADGGDATQPVRIVAARNGTFSGKIMVASRAGIHGLVAVPGDLEKEGGAIAAECIRVRYGAAWEGMPGFHCPRGLDVLLDSAPQDRPAVSIWVTVAVPRDALPGLYTGKVAVTMRNGPPVAVPVSLSVMDWSLPDTQDFRTWVELIQSPDTLAVEYGVPLWSEPHWKLVARSMKLIGALGSRVVYVPLICRTNPGNEQSMVRWIAKGDGRWDHDFSVMDTYLDLATKNMGRPKVVVFNVWDVYQQDKVLKKGGGRTDEARDESKKLAEMLEKLHAEQGYGPAVTTLDPANGESGMTWLPSFSRAESKDLWAPVFKELHRRLADRGLADTMMLGMFTDVRPTRDEVLMLREISSGLPWVCHAHFKPPDNLHDVAPVGYVTIHEAIVFTMNPALGRTYGWRQEKLVAEHFRVNALNRLTASAARCLLEERITGGERGIGYVGADLWPVLRNGRGLRIGTVTDRYPESAWRNLEIRSSLLAPGHDGAVATARYENLREGLQECEARIAIERALTDPALRPTLGQDLADRAQALLDERQHAIWKEKGLTDDEIQAHGTLTNWMRALKYDPRFEKPVAGYKWFLASGWQNRAEKLYGLAGEVARKLAASP